ncbi:uncharacterized protein [Clytia hemisphaerica]|uniref:SMODS and SLOG-associating 2TM effector domain-containing protein n=1 Tax=Clytia hemisphaerica TaxID=252671 RepID=A0A7M5XHX2_9CNID
MRRNWNRFIEVTETKSKAHEREANYWDNVHTVFSLLTIFLGAATTFLSLIKAVPTFAISGIAAANTLISTVIAFIKPHDRRQKHDFSAKEFKVLMMRMVRAETEREYEELWRELNKALVEEPSVSTSGKKNNQVMTWSITPELLLVIGEKEHEVVKTLGEDAFDNAEMAHELSLSVPNYKRSVRASPRVSPVPSDDENYHLTDDQDPLIPKK